VAQGADRRVPPAGAVHPSTGVGRGAGQVEARHRRLRTPEASRGPQHQLLVQGRGAGVEGAAAQAAVGVLQVARRLHLTAPPGRQEPGRHPLHGLLHALDLLAHRSLVGREPARQVGVGPDRLGALRRPGGVGRRHLPEEHERVRRHPSHGEVGGHVDEAVVVDAEVHRAGPPRSRRRPRDGCVEGPVDLERRVVPLEPPHVVQEPWREVAGADEVAVERRCRHVREDGVARLHDVAVREPHPTGSAAGHLHLGHGHPAAHLNAQRLRTPTQCRGEHPRASFRHGEPDVLAEHHEQPPEQRAAGAVGGDVAVHRVAAEQHPRLLAAELLLAQAAYREQAEPGQVERAGHPGAPQQAGSGPHGREGREEGVEQGVTDAVPAGHHPQPGVAVAGVVAVQAGCGVARRAAEHRAPTVGKRVGHHVGGMAPGEAVPLEVQVADHRAGRRQRVEGAEQVGDEAARHALGTAHRAADLVLRLDEHHVPAGVGEPVGGHQTVGARPDHHGVAGRRGHRASLRGRRAPGGAPGCLPTLPLRHTPAARSGLPAVRPGTGPATPRPVRLAPADPNCEESTCPRTRS
jgi:hypothetical protein